MTAECRTERLHRQDLAGAGGRRHGGPVCALVGRPHDLCGGDRVAAGETADRPAVLRVGEVDVLEVVGDEPGLGRPVGAAVGGPVEGATGADRDGRRRVERLDRVQAPGCVRGLVGPVLAAVRRRLDDADRRGGADARQPAVLAVGRKGDRLDVAWADVRRGVPRGAVVRRAQHGRAAGGVACGEPLLRIEHEDVLQIGGAAARRRRVGVPGQAIGGRDDPAPVADGQRSAVERGDALQTERGVAHLRRPRSAAVGAGHDDGREEVAADRPHLRRARRDPIQVARRRRVDLDPRGSAAVGRAVESTVEADRHERVGGGARRHRHPRETVAGASGEALLGPVVPAISGRRDDAAPADRPGGQGVLGHHALQAGRRERGRQALLRPYDAAVGGVVDRAAPADRPSVLCVGHSKVGEADVGNADRELQRPGVTAVGGGGDLPAASDQPAVQLVGETDRVHGAADARAFGEPVLTLIVGFEDGAVVAAREDEPRLHGSDVAQGVALHQRVLPEPGAVTRRDDRERRSGEHQRHRRDGTDGRPQHPWAEPASMLHDIPLMSTTRDVAQSLRPPLGRAHRLRTPRQARA